MADEKRIDWVVTCCWSSKPCSVKVAEVFDSEKKAGDYVMEQEALAANHGAKFIVWGREVK